MNEETFKTIAAQLRRPEGDHAIEVGKKMNEGNRHINLYTIEVLKPTAGDSILEIGMGNGFFVKEIVQKDPTIKYVGCDFSEMMISEARKYNEKFIQNGQAEFFLASAEKLPFDNGSFHKVFSVNTIYFWDDPQLTLAEIRRVLKPQGQIIISIRPKSIMQDYPFTRYGFAMFTKDELAGLLTENNFRVSNVLEKEEPEQEINGQKVKVETLIVCAEK